MLKKWRILQQVEGTLGGGWREGAGKNCLCGEAAGTLARGLTQNCEKMLLSFANFIALDVLL
jgi:hypothetical protein